MYSVLVGYLYGFLCITLICSLCVGRAVLLTWPSSTLRLFESSNTTLHRPMTEGELSLFGSLSSISTMIGTPLISILLEKIGRKYCAIVSSLMAVVSWAMIIASNRVEVLLSAMFVSGLSGTVFLVVPVYISEFCQDSIRGAMTSGVIIFYGFGALLSYLLGGYLNYHTMIYVFLTLSIIGTILIAILKESPLYLMTNKREEEAKKSIAFYRSLKTDDKEVLEEICSIKRALNPDMDSEDNDIPEAEKLQPSTEAPKKLSLWQFFKKSRSTRRATVVCLVVATASTFQGLIVVEVYAKPLFEEAVPNISGIVCSVILAVVCVCASLGAAYLSESAGRRALMIYSSFGTAISCLVLGSQIQTHWAPSWVTAVFMYIYTVAYSLGAGIIPYVIIAEVFLPEVKLFLSMLVLEWLLFCNSAILYIFNPLLNAIGLGPIFYIFAVVCFLTSFFCFFYLPETKGMPVDVIQMSFYRKRKEILALN
ncbi:hypothetical protein K1T71_013158 [Dendrolimus kikuchii]|uniref:Uncharacterized protein n=1 Tax=Dendrolimus kikuchii TaxID=765133 RepID=A0ACC1CJ55_9NEOP|nr:hypothetical protein K1T71_013158 [Dendrolimus kikuchii]